MFRHKPAGKHLVRVCRGTACHVNGAERVEDALRRELNLEEGEDTDHAGRFTVEQVACLGCCTLAPVVRIGQSTFGHSTAEKVPGILHDFSRKGQALTATHIDDERSAGVGRAQITIGLGSCCMAKGSDDLFRALRESVSRSGVNVTVKGVGCVGMCHRTPLIEVTVPGKTRTIYSSLQLTQAQKLVNRHFRS
jgi:NADH:ubiquinone oxidoreductase subunit E